MPLNYIMSLRKKIKFSIMILLVCTLILISAKICLWAILQLFLQTNSVMSNRSHCPEKISPKSHNALWVEWETKLSLSCNNEESTVQCSFNTPEIEKAIEKAYTIIKIYEVYH